MWAYRNPLKKPYFRLDDGILVYCFVEAPLLIKLCRYHFLYSGFVVNGEFVGAQHLKDLLSFQCDVGTAYKLTKHHFTPKMSPKRQNVRLAVQLFLNRNAASLKRVNDMSFSDKSIPNDFFDIMNSTRANIDSRPSI